MLTSTRIEQKKWCFHLSKTTQQLLWNKDGGKKDKTRAVPAFIVYATCFQASTASTANEHSPASLQNNKNIGKHGCQHRLNFLTSWTWSFEYRQKTSMIVSWLIERSREVAGKIDLANVCDANLIMTNRQSSQNLQCLSGNPMANNFLQNWILHNFWIKTLKLFIG